MAAVAVFLANPIGRMVVIGILLFGAGFWTSNRYHHVADMKAENASLRDSLSKTEALLKSKEVRETVLQASLDARGSQIDAIRTELQSRPEASKCYLSPADRQRLLNITPFQPNHPASGSKRSRVPGPRG